MPQFVADQVIKLVVAERVNHRGSNRDVGPFDAARYHSLVVAGEPWPEALEIAARAEDDGVVMALRHRRFPMHGVQFHPESVLTPAGRRLLRNFLERA